MRMLNESRETTVTSGNTQTLPIRPASQLASHADIVAHMLACPARAAHLADNDQGRIFVVDVGPERAAFANKLLKQRGYQARAFDSAITAWHAFAFANPEPDVLITDEGTGDLSGLELIGHCRQLNPGLKTLLFSHRQRSELTRRERALVDDVLPVADCGSLLVERVGQLLRNKDWQWKKLWGALGLLSRKSHNATA